MLPDLRRLSIGTAAQFYRRPPFIQFSFHKLIQKQLPIDVAEGTTTVRKKRRKGDGTNEEHSDDDVDEGASSVQDFELTADRLQVFNVLNIDEEELASMRGKGGRALRVKTFFESKGFPLDKQNVYAVHRTTMNTRNRVDRMGLLQWDAISKEIRFSQEWPAQRVFESYTLFDVNTFKSGDELFLRIGRPTWLDELPQIDCSNTTDDALNLMQEYELQCAWLRLISVPSVFANARSKSACVQRRLEFPNDDEFWSRVEHGWQHWNLDEYPNFYQPYDVMQDDQRDARYDAARERAYYEERLAIANARAPSELSTPAFKVLVQRDTLKPPKEVELYKGWLRWFVTANEGANIYERFARAPLDEKDMLSLEHTTPDSWFRPCTILREFTHAADDPVVCTMADKTVNSSRNNRAYGFDAISNDRVWPVNRLPLEAQAFLARAVIYATLTYPLLSDRGQEDAFQNLNFQDDVRSQGIYPYAEQHERIFALASKEPSAWEVELAFAVYRFFGAINPFVVHRKNRDLLSTDADFRKLILARWRGKDRITNMILSEMRAYLFANQ